MLYWIFVQKPFGAHNMLKLTDRQQEILDLIRDRITHNGMPPTRVEIAEALGFRSPNAAEEHLKALERKGAIEIVPGASRGIRLKQAAGKQLTLPHASLMQLSLPLVGRVAAGSPLLASEHIEATYQFDAALFSQPPDYLLKVRGLSMRDAGILDGDLLAVKRAAEAKNGQIVVARIGDEVTVKRFRKRGNAVELLPENPDFEPIVLDSRRDDYALEGIGVGLIRAGGGL
jgi:repressor LexA